MVCRNDALFGAGDRIGLGGQNDSSVAVAGGLYPLVYPHV